MRHSLSSLFGAAILAFSAPISGGATILGSVFNLEIADTLGGTPTSPITEGTEPSSITILVDYLGITGGRILLRPEPGEVINMVLFEAYAGNLRFPPQSLAQGLGYPNAGTQPGDQFWYSTTRISLFDNPYIAEDFLLRFVVESNLGTFYDDNDGEGYRVIGTVPEPSLSGLAVVAGTTILLRRRHGQ